MRSFSFATARSGAPAFPTLLAALLFALLVAGCADSGSGITLDEEEGAEAPTYTIGEPIEDASYAVIVSSEYGGDTLTTQEFTQQFDQIAQQAPTAELDESQAAELRRNIVEQFVMRHVLFGEADAIDAGADSAEVGARVEQLRQQLGGDERFQRMLAAQNMDEDELRAMIADQMRGQAVQEELAAGAEAPTEEETEAFRQERAEEVRAQHILFLAGQDATPAEEDSVRSLAEAVLDSIRSEGADFGEMARRHSQDGSAESGGELPYFSRGQMVPPFEEAAFALEDSGDVTAEPVRTRFGYHLIRKTGERETEPMDTSRARQMLVQEREREAMREGLEALRAKTTVRINPSVIEGVDLSEPFDIMRGG